MGAEGQPWFEAIQLDAEQESKLVELQKAVAAVVNVSEPPPPALAAAAAGPRRHSFDCSWPCLNCHLSARASCLDCLPRLRRTCACLPPSLRPHAAAPPRCSRTGVGVAPRLLHARHLHSLPARAALEREEGDQGGCWVQGAQRTGLRCWRQARAQGIARLAGCSHRPVLAACHPPRPLQMLLETLRWRAEYRPEALHW